MKLTDEQRVQVVDNIPIVKYVMKKFFPYMKPWDDMYDDLLQTGYERLCWCVVHYCLIDKETCSSLANYAIRSCYFSMYNYYRENQPGRVGKRLNNGKYHISGYCTSLNEPVTGEDGCNTDFGEIIPDEYDAYDMYNMEDYLERVFIKASPVHGKKIFNMMKRGYTMRDVADEIGVTHQRIQYIKDKAYKLFLEMEV